MLLEEVLRSFLAVLGVKTRTVANRLDGQCRRNINARSHIKDVLGPRYGYRCMMRDRRCHRGDRFLKRVGGDNLGDQPNRECFHGIDESPGQR
jgi:hypothetical protein